jgi:hypothetical protein
MSFWNDHALLEKAGFLEFQDLASAIRTLRPGQGVETVFRAVAGPVRVSVCDLQLDVYQPPAGPYQRVPLRVELYAPGIGVPVAQWMTAQDPDQIVSKFELLVGPTGAPEGEWRCRVSNLTPDMTADCQLCVGHTSKRVRKETLEISTETLDDALVASLDALAPRIDFLGDQLEVSFQPELRDFFRDEGATTLRSQVMDLAALSLVGRLRRSHGRVASGAQLLAAVDRLWEAKGEGIRRIPDAGLRAVLAIVNDNWRKDWGKRVATTDPVIHLQLACPDGRARVSLYYAFDRRLSRIKLLVVPPLAAEGFLGELVETVGIADATAILHELLAPVIQGAAPQLGRYLGEAVIAAVRRDHVFWRVTALADEWHVEVGTDPRHETKPASLPASKIDEERRRLDSPGA